MRFRLREEMSILVVPFIIKGHPWSTLRKNSAPKLLYFNVSCDVACWLYSFEIKPFLLWFVPTLLNALGSHFPFL